MCQVSTYGNPLNYWFEHSPDRVALVSGSERYSFAGLYEMKEQVKRHLEAKGLGPGSVVACSMGSTALFAALFYACLDLGVILVPSDTAIDQDTLRYRFERSRAQFIVVEKGEVPPPGAAWRPDEILAVTVQRGEDLSVSASESESKTEEDAAKRPACVMYTSGSTGEPKGVCLSVASLLIAATNLANRMGLSQNDRVLAPMPLSHLFGLVSGLLTTHVAGAQLIVMGKYSADEALEILEKEKVTIHHGVPSMIKRELDRWEVSRPGRSLPDLRTGMLAGATVPASLIYRAQDLWNASLVAAYGSTETVNVSCGDPRDDVVVRASTAGKPFASALVQIAAETDDHGGEILVGGPGVMLGYLGADGTLEPLQGPWVATGDLGTMRGGYLSIVGRCKSMIIRNGNNIIPSVLEAVYQQLPGINEVCVLGFPHEEYGEGVALAISGRTELYDDEALRDIARAHVARYAAPDMIVRCDKLPYLPNGKVDRRELERRLAEEMCGSSR